MAGVVFITSKPVDAFVKGRWEPDFKFLPVKYESKFEDYYLPAVSIRRRENRASVNTHPMSECSPGTALAKNGARQNSRGAMLPA
jgi:hypothetical protein